MNVKNGKLNIKATITALYISLVWMIFSYSNGLSGRINSVIRLIFFLICSYVLSKAIFTRIDKMEKFTWNTLSKKNKLIIFSAAAIISLGWMMIWYVAYYPGSFTADQMQQYSQAVTGVYSDWHPVLHTLFFFTIPLKLTGQVAAIVFFQIMYFSLIMGYLAASLCELGGMKLSAISCLYIWLNPYVGYMMLCPWKDVGFALGGILCLVIAVRLIAEKKKTAFWRLVVLGILLACTTVFRHNAILYTGPLIVAMAFNMEKKSWIKIVLCFAVCLFVIKVPLYRALDVSKPGLRVGEATGLPLTIIGNVATETPELMDTELSEFVYSIATPEKWANSYSTGNFNSTKWSGGIDPSSIEEKGLVGMLHLTIKCFRLSPKASFRALFFLTDMVYGFENGLEGDVKAEIVDNDYGIQYPKSYNYKCRVLVNSYSDFINNSMFRYLRTYGVVLITILFFALAGLNYKSWSSWKKVFMVFPVFTYDYGTMLLLTGPDSRFFFITFLVAPLMIGYLLSSEEKLKNG